MNRTFEDHVAITKELIRSEGMIKRTALLRRMAYHVHGARLTAIIRVLIADDLIEEALVKPPRGKPAVVYTWKGY